MIALDDKLGDRNRADAKTADLADLQFVRVRLERNHSSTDIIDIDVTIDQQFNIMKLHPSQYFGLAHKKDDHRWPFTLLSNGTVDFSSDYPDPIRYWTTNLFTRQVIPGTYVTFLGLDANLHDQEWTYVVKRVFVPGIRNIR